MNSKKAMLVITTTNSEMDRADNLNDIRRQLMTNYCFSAMANPVSTQDIPSDIPVTILCEKQQKPQQLGDKSLRISLPHTVFYQVYMGEKNKSIYEQ